MSVSVDHMQFQLSDIDGERTVLSGGSIWLLLTLAGENDKKNSTLRLFHRSRTDDLFPNNNLDHPGQTDS